MFDRTTITHEQPRYPQRVEQHLAPTADHLRLLAEFQAAAREELMERIPLTGNVLGVLTGFNSAERATWVCLFELNGERIRVELPDVDTHRSHTADDVMRAAHQAIAREIAAKITYTAAMGAITAKAGNP